MESTATKTSSPSKSDVSPTKSSDEAAAAAESPGKASSSDKQGDANTSSSSSSPNKSSGVIAPASSPIKSDESSSPNKPGEDPGVGGENASPTKEEIKKNVSKAMQHLYAGKRNMLVKDYNNAVTELAESSRLLGETYGETAVECAEAYYHYGKALLELARLESGVLGTAVQEESEKSDDEESDEDNEASEEKNDTEDQEMKEVEDQAEEGKEEKTPEIKGKEKAKDKEEEETKDKEEEAKDKEEESKDEGSGGKEKDNESIGSNEAGTSELKDTHDKREIDNEDVEDPSNLQLSWEMLELAKSLFQKHADSLEAEDSKRMDLESKLSETYQILGEVSIENENYEQACEDLTCCLRRRQELLPEDSRCIAETHYQLGVALGFNLEFDKAIGALNDAIFVLNKRISLLKEKKESPDPAVTNDAFYSREREVKEIESLIPEIHEKIADTKDMQQETFKKLGDKALMEEDEIEAVSPTKQNGPGKSNGDSGKGDSKPTSDISHMIKKRKKSSTPVSGVEEPAPKKQNL